jgi:hypothetical protein
MRWGVFGAARDICDWRSDNIGHDAVARGGLIPANQSVPLIVDALTLSVVRLSESRKDEGRDLLRQGRRRETWRGLSPVRSVVSRPYSSMLVRTDHFESSSQSRPGTGSHFSVYRDGFSESLSRFLVLSQESRTLMNVPCTY